MCYGCWEKYGSPAIDTPAVRQAAKLVERVYGFSEVGGGLHVVVDDFNIEDEFLDARYDGHDEYNSPGQVGAENECLGALRGLTLAERAAAIGLHRGYWQ